MEGNLIIDSLGVTYLIVNYVQTELDAYSGMTQNALVSIFEPNDLSNPLVDEIESSVYRAIRASLSASGVPNKKEDEYVIRYDSEHFRCVRLPLVISKQVLVTTPIPGSVSRTTKQFQITDAIPAAIGTIRSPYLMEAPIQVEFTSAPIIYPSKLSLSTTDRVILDDRILSISEITSPITGVGLAYTKELGVDV